MGPARTQSTAATNRLRGMGVFLDVFGDEADGVGDDLQETALHIETAGPASAANGQDALSQQGHEGDTTGEGAPLPVVGRRNDAVGFAVEYCALGSDDENSHQELASSLARAITYSMPPCM